MASAGLRVTFSSSMFESNHFFSLCLFFHCCVNLCKTHQWSADCSVVFSPDHKNLIYANLLSNLKRDHLYHHTVVLLNFVLTISHTDNGKDFFWMGWDGDSNFSIVHVQNWMLFFNFNRSFTYFLFSPFLLFARKWDSPCLINFRVFWNLVEIPFHLFRTILI